MLVFKEKGKPEYPEKTLWEQEREPTDSPGDVLRGSSRLPAPCVTSQKNVSMGRLVSSKMKKTAALKLLRI